MNVETTKAKTTKATVESVATKIVGALVLTGGFLGAFALLARMDVEGAAMAAAPAAPESVTASTEVPAPADVPPTRALGDVGSGSSRMGTVDVADLAAAIRAEGDAPGPDSTLGRPPHATRLFSGKLDTDGTRMFVYETTASAKETQRWADERAQALGLGRIAFDGSGASLGDEGEGEAEERAEVPGAKPLDAKARAREAAGRTMYGGHDGRVAFSIKDTGDKRVVTLVTIGNEKLEPPVPRAVP